METDTKQHFYDVSNLLRTCSIVFCAKTSSEHVALVKKVARKYLPRFWITGKLQFRWTYSIARQRLTLLLKNVTPFFIFCKHDHRTVAQPEWGQRGHATPTTNLLRFLLVLYINFQQLENKRKEQSDSRRRQWLTTSLAGPSRIKLLAALLLPRY